MIPTTKTFTTILVMLLSISYALGQQLPGFTQYSEYGSIINPGHMLFDNYHFDRLQNAGVSYRDQWSKIPDRPKTFVARYEVSTNRDRGTNLTLGGYLINNEIGVFRSTEFKLRAAGFIKTTRSYRRVSGFSIGIAAGAGQYEADLSQFSNIEIDPILFQERTNSIYPDLGIGISYINEFRNKDYIQLGASVPQIFALDPSFTSGDRAFNITQKPHYYLTASYYKMFTDETFLEFSSWVRQVQSVPATIDVNVRYRFMENIWVGLGFNTAGIIHTEAGIVYMTDDENQIRLGYGYNPTFGTNATTFGHTHELNITYAFGEK